MIPFEILPLFRLETSSVIPDLKLHILGGEIKDHLDSRCMRMFYDIGHGFLADTQQVVLDCITDFPQGALHREVQCYGAARQRSLACYTKRLGQIIAVRKRR